MTTQGNADCEALTRAYDSVRADRLETRKVIADFAKAKAERTAIDVRCLTCRHRNAEKHYPARCGGMSAAEGRSKPTGALHCYRSTRRVPDRKPGVAYLADMEFGGE